MTPIMADGLPDDRVTCAQCQRGEAHRHWCRHFKAVTMPDMPRRCVHFIPLKALPDQRSGAERWPRIVEEIASVRALDEQRNRL